MTRRWRIYLIVTGVLAAIGVLMPDLVAIGYFFIVPGLVLHFAPSAFLYGLLLYGLLRGTSGRPWFVRGTAIVGVIATVAVGVPTLANLREQGEEARLTAQDSAVIPPAPEARSLTITRNLADRHWSRKPEDNRAQQVKAALVCDDLCLRLLYNRAFERVVMAAAPDARPDGPVEVVAATTYRLVNRPACQSNDHERIVTWNEDATAGANLPGAAARISARIAIGECVVAQAGPAEAQARPAEVTDLTLLLVSTPPAPGRSDHPFALDPGTLQAHRLELRRAGDAAVLYRKTLVTRAPLSLPFSVGYVGAGGLRVRPALHYRGTYGTNFDANRQLFVGLFGTRVMLPAFGASPEQVRGQLVAVLDDKAAPADLVQQRADALFRMIEARKQGTAEDVAVIGRAIADPRLTSFLAFHHTIYVLRAQLDPLAPTVIARMSEPPMANSADRGDRVSSLAHVINVLSTEAIRSIGPQLVRLSTIPWTRGRGALALSRLGDLGPMGIDVLLGLLDLETGSRRGAIADNDGSARLQALRGLCLAGDASPRVTARMEAVLRTAIDRAGEAGHLGQDGGLAAGALVKAGLADRLEGLMSAKNIQGALTRIVQGREPCRM